MSLVIDVSKFQQPKGLDWDRLRAIHETLLESGDRLGVVIIPRATYGSKGPNVRDPAFPRFVELTRKAGLRLSAYHFYRQTTPWTDQYGVFQEYTRRYVDWEPSDFVPMFDLEDNRRNGDGRLNKAIVNVECPQMCAAMLEEYGGLNFYYSSYLPDLLGARKGDEGWKWMQGLSRTLHHLADYSVAPGAPRTPYTRRWHLHQYKPEEHDWYNPDSGGYAVEIDVNVANLSDQVAVAQLADYGLIGEKEADPYDEGMPMPHYDPEIDVGFDVLANGLAAAATGAFRLAKAYGPADDDD